MKRTRLEIFRHLYAAVAEEMGAALMRSAFSPNIKERRDFSCAVFDARGEMVAQAAHIPVHLGSTPLSVKAAIEAFGAEITPESPPVVLNDPYAGGTHLPDITLVSAVFDASGTLRFWVANRAHHSDVGGITAGSLPLSSHLDDEGIRIAPSWLDETMIDEIAAASRTPDERRGDLRAQLAANHRGALRLSELLQKDDALVAATELLDYSERFMREVLSELPDGRAHARDFLDGDGHTDQSIPVECEVVLDGDSARVDFSASSDQVRGPLNVPRAVTLSATLYAFRCLAPRELPSNGGYMRAIEVVTRSGSILDARYPAAVAAGNVETSQRVVDVVMRALSRLLPGRIPAASCGSMNNVTIGSVAGAARAFAYYETIGGGVGAGRDFDGESAVHTHMTNTLNTPVEALENSYPFRVAEYRIRRGSGGRGTHRGGDGVVRAYEFTDVAEVTLMTERRKHAPWGLEGGEDGKRGRNVLIRDGAERELPAKCTFEVQAGDVVRIETPGGGGFGSE